jgi:hypothetical protein
VLGGRRLATHLLRTFAKHVPAAPLPARASRDSTLSRRGERGFRHPRSPSASPPRRARRR